MSSTMHTYRGRSCRHSIWPQVGNIGWRVAATQAASIHPACKSREQRGLRAGSVTPFKATQEAGIARYATHRFGRPCICLPRSWLRGTPKAQTMAPSVG